MNFCKCIYVELGLERQFQKYHSICPPSASITSWRHLEKALHESRMIFWGILAHSFRRLTFRASKLWWWTVETLLSRYNQIPKSRGFRPREDGSHSTLVMKWGTFSAMEATTETFWLHMMVQSPAEKILDGFWSALDPRSTIHQQGWHLDSSASSISPLDQQKSGDFFRTLLRLPRLSLRPDIAS